MTNWTSEQKQSYNDLLLQLNGIDPALLAHYRNEDFYNSCASVQEELFELLNALIKLKKLDLTNDRALSLQINEFIIANIKLSHELSSTNDVSNWKIPLNMRLKNLSTTVRLYENVIDAINMNHPDLSTKCNSMITHTDNMRQTMLKNDNSTAAQLTIKIIGAVFILAAIATLIACPFTVPALVMLGVLPTVVSSIFSALMTWVVPAIIAGAVAAGTFGVFLGAGICMISSADDKLQRKSKFTNVEDSAKKMQTNIKLGLFKQEFSQAAIELDDLNNNSVSYTQQRV